MSRRKLYNSLFILLYWVFSVNFVTTFSLLGVRAFLDYAGIDPDQLTDKMALYFISTAQYIEGLVSSVFLGLLFLFVNELSDRFHWDRLGFGRLILVKSSCYLVGLVMIFYGTYSIIHALGYYPQGILDTFYFTSEVTWIFIMIGFFIALQIILLNYIIQTNRKIGDFNVISFLTGKYREPVLENRLFMFIDLRSSTAIAEKLGHVLYSQLIRECFKDFNYVLRSYRGIDIHQYVGDEVVVTTRWEGAQSVESMVKLYFAFANRLQSRSDRYMSKYEGVPYFKAGLHGGTVSVAEIGTLRRAIAFHGDVMNTAARIQGLCNQLEQGLLVSERVLRYGGKPDGFEVLEMGEVELRGKEDTIPLKAIVEKAEVPAKPVLAH